MFTLRIKSNSEEICNNNKENSDNLSSSTYK